MDKLVKLKYIDQTTANLSKLEPIPGKPIPLPQNALHLLNRFKAEKSLLELNSSRITSTLNENIQLKVISILKRYNNRYRANDINNIAALILNARTGEVVSYVGNLYQPLDPALQSNIDMIKAPRSPGSTLKPLLYASILNDGFILPHTLIPDIPTQIAGYSPKKYMGMVRTLNHFNTYKGLYNPNDYKPPSYIYSQTKEEKDEQRNAYLDHASIWATFNAMEEVMRPGDEGLWEQFSSSKRIAWKTGTSFGF